MNNNNAYVQGTANSGEAITGGNRQQIPLQVVQPQIIQPVQVSHQRNQDDCCGNCECCAMKPASYKSGVYKIDYIIYHYSYLILREILLVEI